jgi:hypothetical protein
MPAERRGLAPERTALGWQRSALSLALIAALVALHSLDRGEPFGVAAAGLPAAGAAWVQIAGRRLYRRRTAGDARDAGGGVAAHGPLRGLMALTCGAALLAAAVVVGGR